MIEATITSKLMQSGFVRNHIYNGTRFYLHKGTVDIKLTKILIRQVYAVDIYPSKNEIDINSISEEDSKAIKFNSIKSFEVISDKENLKKNRQTYLSTMRKSANNYKILREKLKSFGWRQVLSKEKNVIIVEGSYVKIKYKHYEGAFEKHTINKMKFDFTNKDVILVKIGNLRYTRLNSLSDLTIEEDKKKKLQEVKYLDW